MIVSVNVPWRRQASGRGPGDADDLCLERPTVRRDSRGRPQQVRDQAGRPGDRVCITVVVALGSLRRGSHASAWSGRGNLRTRRDDRRGAGQDALLEKQHFRLFRRDDDLVVETISGKGERLEHVFRGQPRILLRNFGCGKAATAFANDMFQGRPRPPNNRFSARDSRIDLDTRVRHLAS